MKVLVQRSGALIFVISAILIVGAAWYVRHRRVADLPSHGSQSHVGVKTPFPSAGSSEGPRPGINSGIPAVVRQPERRVEAAEDEIARIVRTKPGRSGFQALLDLIRKDAVDDYARA